MVGVVVFDDCSFPVRIPHISLSHMAVFYGTKIGISADRWYSYIFVGSAS